jgi:hypothetical protein
MGILGTLLCPCGLHIVGSYRGTSLTRERFPFGPYSRPMPRPLRRSYGSRRFLMSEVPLDDARVGHSPHAFVVPCVGRKGSPETQRVM